MHWQGISYCTFPKEGIYKCIKYGFFNEKLVLQMYKYDKKISADMNIQCVCIRACLTVNPSLLVEL